jgi:hypothetical protein
LSIVFWISMTAAVSRVRMYSDFSWIASNLVRRADEAPERGAELGGRDLDRRARQVRELLERDDDVGGEDLQAGPAPDFAPELVGPAERARRLRPLLRRRCSQGTSISFPIVGSNRRARFGTRGS